jgi:hypothetical protein
VETDGFLYIHISLVVCDGAVHHGLGHLVGCNPVGLLRILLELDFIFFAFLKVTVLVRATIASESFVVTNMSRIANLETAKHRWLNWLRFLFGEFFGGTISHHFRVKSASLANDGSKGLVPVQNFAIVVRIFVSL